MPHLMLFHNRRSWRSRCTGANTISLTVSVDGKAYFESSQSLHLAIQEYREPTEHNQRDDEQYPFQSANPRRRFCGIDRGFPVCREGGADGLHVAGGVGKGGVFDEAPSTCF
jgi:hypothetical protein